MSLDYSYAKVVGVSPAWRLVLEGHGWIGANGHDFSRDGFPTSKTDEAVYGVEAAGEIVAVLCWRRSELEREVEITLLYVEPSSRRLGWGRRLFAAMVEKLPNEDFDRVLVSVHAQNEEAEAALLGFGFSMLSKQFVAALPVK